jgi:hypothetical protein
MEEPMDIAEVVIADSKETETEYCSIFLNTIASTGFDGKIIRIWAMVYMLLS